MPLTDAEQIIEGKVRTALESFLNKDVALLERNASERSMSHKLAEHLQAQFPQWDVDCEYNRRGDLPKTLLVYRGTIRADDQEAKTVFPDIIIHKRGTTQNLLVVEIKKSTGLRDFTWDWDKLMAFTDPSQQYNYTLGLFIEFDVEARCPSTMEWFKAGARLPS